MKFLIFSNYLPFVLNFRGQLLETIALKGYEIHIIAPDLKIYPKEYEMLTSLGYYIHSVPMERAGTNPATDIRTLLSTFRLLKKIKPDFVLSYTIKPVIYGSLAAWLANVPNRFALITGLGYTFKQVEETDTRSKFQKVIHELYKYALSKTHKVFFQNPDDLNLFKKLELLSLEIPTIVVNGSGVSVEDFEVLPFPRDDTGAIAPSFLLIARLLKDKGIVEYIAAAKKLKSRYPKAEFHLVGWIDENPEAISQQQLDSWVSEGIINYWGKLSDVRPAIAACSVYVLPSYREGTPRTVLEAMSMGRPIITTDAPGCRETVVSGENGFLIPVQDAEALFLAMKQFIEKPCLYEQMGKASRRISIEKYDVNKVNAQMILEMEL